MIWFQKEVKFGYDALIKIPVRESSFAKAMMYLVEHFVSLRLHK